MAQGRDTMIAAIMIALAGVASAAVYVLRRQWIEALLVVVAAAGLAGLVGKFSLPPGANAGVARQEARASDDAMLRLDFPHVAAPGRMFRLSASMPRAKRLQLLAENGQVVAESSGEGPALTVQWLPPVTETLLFKARLSDASGNLLAEGPVPFEVRDAVPLQVQGSFGSPSFDAGALNALLVNSNAVLDWQVTLGKTVTRSETARTTMTRPDLLVVDAAYVERLSETARAALLAQVAAGSPLLVLAANAREPQLWSRTLQLALKEQAEGKPSGAPLALISAPFNPSAKAVGPWSSVGDRVWSRPWEKGRVIWLGVSDWHRYAISEPQALGVWWQDVLDRTGIRRAEELVWQAPKEMPVPGQLLEVCAHGVRGEVVFPGLKQTLTWQRRPDKADAMCVAVWPAAPGWMKMETDGKAGQVYVYEKADWPLWQKAQLHDAASRQAARTPAVHARSPIPLPAWPFALLFAAAMLALWWRERRQELPIR
jgi:hypothetical protein